MTSDETAASRVWFFPTSPRSPYKIKPELDLIRQVSHLPWSRTQGQKEFGTLLANAKTFEGDVSQTDPTFSARDRTRGPKILGLVEQVGRGESATIKITEAGEKFLSLEEDEETAFFLNQIAKVQFPSAQHNSRGFADMDCRPLTIALHIMLEVGALTKEEFGLFVLPCTRASESKTLISKLGEFRQEIKSAPPGLPRKQLKDQLINQRVSDIYQADIKSGNTALREGGKNFIATKRQTLMDYADSSFRYLLATGLFRIDPNGRTFSVLDSKRGLAQDLISDLGLGSTYKYYQPKKYVQDYLGAPSEPKISYFSREAQSERLAKLLDLADLAGESRFRITEEILAEPLGFVRDNLIQSVARGQTNKALEEKAKQLVVNRSSITPDILETFESIVSRDPMVDRPLFFEWNTWRAFTMLNDAYGVIGNFRSDTEGNPLSLAPGKQPDIVAEYDSFWLAIEVTLSTGHKQYESESESINRHVGTLQAKLKQQGDPRPVYGLFIAPKVNETVLNYLMTCANLKSAIYQGPVRIAPLNLEDFCAMVSKHKDAASTDSKKLQRALEEIFDEQLITSGDEPAWFEATSRKFRELQLY